jgi:type II secretion system protein N
VNFNFNNLKKLSPETLRRLRRAAINTGVFWLVFIFALYVWFPYDRAKEMAINMAAAQGLDVDIESAGPAWGVGVSFSNIRVKTRPTTGKPTRFSIQRASVTTSIFGLLFSSSPPFDIALDAFGGSVELSQSGAPGKKGPFRFEVTARGVNLNEVPGIRETINMPVFGTLKLDVDLASSSGKFADSKGAISFLCEACVAGDGKSPLKVEGNAFLGGGLTLPKVRIGDLHGEIAVDKGLAKLKGIESKSPDGEISLEGDVSLRDPLPNSIVNAYLRFKLSDAFLKSASTMQTILQMAGAAGRRPDGSYGVRMSGRLGSPTMGLSASSPVGGPTPPVRPGARSTPPPAYIPPSPSVPPQAMPSPPPPPPVAENPPPPPPPAPAPEQQAAPPPPEPVRGSPPPAPAPVVDEAAQAPPARRRPLRSRTNRSSSSQPPGHARREGAHVQRAPTSTSRAGARGDHRRRPGAARRAHPGGARRPHDHARARHGRERDGQGAPRARPPRAGTGALGPVRRRELRRASARARRERALRARAGRLHGRGRAARRVVRGGLGRHARARRDW